MCYSIIDIEDELSELKNLIGFYEPASLDLIFWRIGQMLNEIMIGSKLRNSRILLGIYQIEAMMESMADSKNKIYLEIIIQSKKFEIEYWLSLQSRKTNIDDLSEIRRKISSPYFSAY